jgi:predicted nucleotidyltransferase
MENQSDSLRFGLKNETINLINSVFSKFPSINEAIIYGSRAKGNYRDGSDIDISLKGADINLDTLNSISLQLDDTLLPYIIDLSIFHQIDNKELVEHIKRAGKVFYKNEVKR